MTKKIIGTISKPRISIYRSNRFIGGQAIDDAAGKTISASSTIKIAKGKPAEKAALAGKTLGESLKAKKVDQVVFDRNHKKYHGNVAAFADGMRETGIKF